MFVIPHVKLLHDFIVSGNNDVVYDQSDSSDDSDDDDDDSDDSDSQLPNNHFHKKGYLFILS